MLENPDRGLRRNFPSWSFIPVILSFAVLAARFPTGMTAEISRRGRESQQRAPVLSRNIRQLNLDADDDDDDDDTNGSGSADIGQRGGQIREYPANYRFPGQVFRRGRFGEAGPMPTERRGDADFGGADGRMGPFPNGQDDLPVAGGGLESPGRYPGLDRNPYVNQDRARMPMGPIGPNFEPDLGPNLGPDLGPMDSTLNNDVPVVDGQYPPRPLDGPTILLDGFNDSYDPRTQDKIAYVGPSEAEIKATCGKIPVTEYLSLKFGTFGMTMLILLLMYMCVVAVYAHMQWIAASQSGDKELL